MMKLLNVQFPERDFVNRKEKVHIFQAYKNDLQDR